MSMLCQPLLLLCFYILIINLQQVFDSQEENLLNLLVIHFNSISNIRPFSPNNESAWPKSSYYLSGYCLNFQLIQAQMSS